MRRSHVGLLWGALCSVAAMGACALDEAGTGADGGGPDVAFDVSAEAGDGGSDALQTGDGDAQTSDVVVIVPGCDGGTVCITSVPGSYKIVEYVGTNPPGCTPGYNAPTNLIENPTAANNACACACNSATPTVAPTCKCGNNTAAFDFFTGSNCGGATSPSEILADTTCYNQTQSLNGNNDAIIAKPDAGCTASGGACGGITATKNFTTTSQQGRRCDLSTSNTPACPNNGICVPQPSGGYALCISDGTMNSCPAGFNVQHVVGTNIVDTRSCNCTGNCGISSTGACSTPTVTLYSGSGCTGANGNVKADGTTCTTGFGTNPTWGSAKYTTNNSGASCAYSGGQYVDGGVALDTTGEYRICCTQ